MISPIAKFALAMAVVIDVVLDEMGATSVASESSLAVTLQEARTELAKAVAVFQATGGAE